MRTVTLRQDVYHGLLTQLQDQAAELAEWRGRRRPDLAVLNLTNLIRVATGLRGQCAGMLAILLQSPGRVFDCDQLVDLAAPYCAGGQKKGSINANAVAKTRVADIRRVLGEHEQADPITTLRAAGYVVQPVRAAALKSWLEARVSPA